MHLADIVGLAGTIIGAVGGVTGIVAFFRLLPKVIDGSRLLAENSSLRDQNSELVETINTLRTIAEGSKTAVDQLKVELAVAMTYVVELVIYLKRGGVNDFPPAPPELQRFLEASLSKRSDVA